MKRKILSILLISSMLFSITACKDDSAGNVEEVAYDAKAEVAKYELPEIPEADKDLKVQIHCFSTSEETLKTFMDWGFYISLGGVVTYGNGYNEKEAAALVPLDRLMLETDSPYLTPNPYRGMRNDPRKIIEVARKIAEIRGMKLSKLAKWTSKNAREFFNL